MIRMILQRSRLLVIMLFLMTLMVFLLTDGHGFTGWLRGQAPAGQMLYLLSKLAGLCAFIVLMFQILVSIFGLLFSKQRRYAPGNSMHISAGIILSGLILLHAGLFYSAVSMRSGHLAWQLFLPDFANGYYSAGVSLGVVAFFLMLYAVYSGLTAKHSGRLSSFGHKLVYPVLLLVFVHAAMIGSEIQSGWLQLLYWLSASGVVAALVVRFAWWGRRSRSGSLEI